MKISKNSKMYQKQKNKIALTLKESESSFLSLTSFDQENHYSSFTHNISKSENNFENYEKSKSERYNEKFNKLSDSTLHSINKSNIGDEDSFFGNIFFKKIGKFFCKIC